MKSAVVMKDLAVIKELGASEMAAVRGGSKFVIQPFPYYGGVDDYCGTVPHPKVPPMPGPKVPPMPGPLPPYGDPIKFLMPGVVHGD